MINKKELEENIIQILENQRGKNKNGLTISVIEKLIYKRILESIDGGLQTREVIQSLIKEGKLIEFTEDKLIQKFKLVED